MDAREVVVLITGAHKSYALYKVRECTRGARGGGRGCRERAPAGKVTSSTCGLALREHHTLRLTTSLEPASTSRPSCVRSLRKSSAQPGVVRLGMRR